MSLGRVGRLDRLFDPLTGEAFLARHWPGTHAVAHGPLQRVGALAELPELHALDALLAAYGDRVRVALADKRDEHSSVQVDTQQAARLHGEGMALIFNAVERFLPPVQGWLEGLRRELGLPRKCDPRSIVYASPAGSGNSPHFDANANFVVQIRGTKTWRLAPNTHVKDPTDRWAMNQAGLSEELEGYVDVALPTAMPPLAQSFTLSPGSVLFVPRGYWHSTETAEDTLAINFTFGQPSWADVMLAALRVRLLKEPKWRALAVGDPALLHGPLPLVAAEDVLALMEAEPTWLLTPRGFLRVDDGVVMASVGAGEFEIDAGPELHAVLEWVGRQRTPFSFEQLARHFPELTPALPELLEELCSRRLLGRRQGRASAHRD